MPRNRKEGFLFTTLMCFCMVLGMSVYNLLLHQQLSWSHFITGFIPGFIVALPLQLLVVGPFSRSILSWVQSK
ncbi:hypothetical protein Q2T76_07360 [Lactobacillus sp. YT155]|uniref:hypothetical protein n=1 Tax=Lactobacillus sp. YT155 TaxID=3060955 RepID=UPI00265F564F|nr:hypothetical protein [Lactobacillus sp. YT155]MDO1605877.1 hypothetical protein [Lactobacillus sp. YT155]